MLLEMLEWALAADTVVGDGVIVGDDVGVRHVVLKEKTRFAVHRVAGIGSLI